MGGETTALPAGEPVNAAISHRRLLIEMAVLIAVGGAAAGVVAGPRSGIGVVFGGLLAYLNYFWLKHSTAAAFEKAFSGGTGRFLTLKYVGRYFALGAVILAVHFSDVMPAVAVIAGLSAFAFAVVVDGFISIFRRNI